MVQGATRHTPAGAWLAGLGPRLVGGGAGGVWCGGACALAWSRAETTVMWPLSAARCRGVTPSCMAALTSAREASSSSSVSVLPRLAAIMRGVAPSLRRAFTCAFCGSKMVVMAGEVW